MGLKLGGLGKVIGAAAGAFLGGPVGAAAGYEAGSMFDSHEAAKTAQSQDRKNYLWELGVNTANNINLWNMQNEYNTPKNQMLRFKEAGLNPNLIYGQTNTAGSIATASGSYGSVNKNQQGLNNYMALSNLGIQRDLSSAQVRNIDNSINMSRLNYGLARDRLALDRDTYELHKAMLPMQLELLKYQVKGAHNKSSGILGKAYDWFFGQRDPHEDLSKADLLELDWN